MATVRTRHEEAVAFVGVVLLAALAGCTSPQISTGARVLPQHERLTYHAYLTNWDQLRRMPEMTIGDPLEVEVGRDYASTYLPKLGGGTVPLRRDGTIDKAVQDRPAIGDEIYEYLPPANETLIVDKDHSYKSPVPEGSIRRAFREQEKFTIDTQVVSTPIALWNSPAGAVMRVEAIGITTMFGVDRDDTVLSREMGVAHRGIADLIQMPDKGWHLLRAFRTRDVKDPSLLQRDFDDLRSMSLSSLRSWPRTAAVYCLQDTDDIPATTLAALQADTRGYEEFDICGDNK